MPATTIGRVRLLPGRATALRPTTPEGLPPTTLAGYAPTAPALEIGAPHESAVGEQRRHHRRLYALAHKRRGHGTLTEADRRLVILSGLVLGVVNAAVHHARTTTPASLAALRDAVTAATRRIPA